VSPGTDVRKRLQNNWIQLLKVNSSKLAVDRIEGSSPPSVFVGCYGYPKVRIGPMISPRHGDTTILDMTELWAGKTLEEIANFRLSLVRGTVTMKIQDITSRYLRSLQELAMSEQSVETEATFEKKPFVDTELEKELKVNTEAAPFGPSAPLKTFVTSSISADKRIESVYYDTDLQAAEALMKMYSLGVSISRIHKVLSVGMLGQKKRRRVVPTRWSISATDDIISSRLIKRNETNSTIDLFEVTEYSHHANHYSVILVPDDVWSFEMIESWFGNNGQIATIADYEDSSGLDHYPTIAGAYFAARLSVADYLAKRRQKAAALVLREIHQEYVVPLGVWQIREGIREALKKPSQKFESFDSALTFAASNLSVSRLEIARNSRLWQILRNQTRITDFS